MSTVLVSVLLGFLYVQLVVSPVWLLPSAASWGWLLVPLVFASTPLWSVLHESVHGSLLRDRVWTTGAAGFSR